MSFAARTTAALTAAVLTAALAGCSGGEGQQVDSGPGWVNRTIYAASKIDVGAGVAAVTALRQDRKLHTVVLDLKNGEELWDQPATMAGRLSGLGVQPPAVVQGPDGGIVVALEPVEGSQQDKQGNEGEKKAIMTARNARTGAEEWTRPVHSTFGPNACGSYVCLAENTAQNDARFVVLDARTGKAIWKAPGIAEVEYANEKSVVLLTMDDNPTLESRDLRTGRLRWELPLSQAVGGAVTLGGGWDFTQIGNSVVGYLGPYRENAESTVPGYGFFAVDVRNGELLWKQRQMVRLYPSPKPSSLLLTRKVVQQGYGGFVRLNPKTGKPATEIPLQQIPKFEWWLGFSADLETLGFISAGRSGAAFDLASGKPVEANGHTVWSYCTRNPQPLPIVGHDGFYATAALCAFNLADGKKLSSDEAPPKWVTGVTDGWRVWRDEGGAVHGIKDGSGTSPGMYG